MGLTDAHVGGVPRASGPKGIKIKIRRDTKEDWEKENPVLADGEPGYEKDTNKLKFGDGVTKWNLLPYFAPVTDVPGDGSWESAILAHINAQEPHPVYDDGPSLVLIYNNAKV